MDPCQRSAQAWSGKCVAKNDGKTTKKWALKKTYIVLDPLYSRLIEPYGLQAHAGINISTRPPRQQSSDAKLLSATAAPACYPQATHRLYPGAYHKFFLIYYCAHPTAD